VHEHLGNLARCARLGQVARDLLQQRCTARRSLCRGAGSDRLAEQPRPLERRRAVVGERLAVGEVLLGDVLAALEREAERPERPASAAERHRDGKPAFFHGPDEVGE
jgi:hypothetical protein